MWLTCRERDSRHRDQPRSPLRRSVLVLFKVQLKFQLQTAPGDKSSFPQLPQPVVYIICLALS